MTAAPLQPPLAAARPPAPRPCPRPMLVAESGAQMRALERDWKRLAALSEPANPFLSWEWQHAFLATARHAHPLIAAEMFPDGSLAGLLALQRVRRRGLVQIGFLGQDTDGDDLDCLLHPLAPPETSARLLQAALQRARPDLILLAGVRRLSPLAQAAAAGALDASETAIPIEAAGKRHEPSGGLRHPPPLPPIEARPQATRGSDPAKSGEPLAPQIAPQIEEGEWMPWLRLPASFDQYLKSQSANFRAEIRRRRRHFEQAAPGAVLVQAETPQAVSAAMHELFRLHNLRRAQKQTRGLFHSPALRRFHLQAATALAARGAARLYLLRQHQHAIAALYGLQAGGRFLYFQSGFDPAWTRLSPGTILLSRVIEDCIQRGLTEFDFLRGKETYKSRWTSEGRGGLTLRAACTWRGRAYLRLRAWRQRHAAAGLAPNPSADQPTNLEVQP